MPEPHGALGLADVLVALAVVAVLVVVSDLYAACVRRARRAASADQRRTVRRGGGGGSSGAGPWPARRRPARDPQRNGLEKRLEVSRG